MYFPIWLYSQIWALAASMKLSVSLQLLRSRTVGRTPWTSDQLVVRLLPVYKHRKTHAKNKHQTFISEVGFQTALTVSELAKTVHGLYHSATITGYLSNIIN
jgi:hypothetical protein